MIELDVVLPVPPAAAWALFTERASEWWPASRRHTGDPASTIRLVPTGRFWEASADGHEVELGVVRAWEPPHRLALDFYVGSGPEAPTSVVVTFTPEGEGTRVAVLHGPTPRSLGIWEERAPRFAPSWRLVLDALAEAAAT